MLPGFSAELMPKGGEKEYQAKIKRYMTMMDSMTNEGKPRSWSRATSELWKHGLYFTPKGQNAIPKEKRLPLKESFPVVICSPSSTFNLAFRMTRVGFLELQDESALTLECIKKGRDWI